MFKRREESQRVFLSADGFTVGQENAPWTDVREVWASLRDLGTHDQLVFEVVCTGLSFVLDEDQAGFREFERELLRFAGASEAVDRLKRTPFSTRREKIFVAPVP